MIICHLTRYPGLATPPFPLLEQQIYDGGFVDESNAIRLTRKATRVSVPSLCDKTTSTGD